MRPVRLLMMGARHWLAAIAAVSVAGPVLAATPESYSKLDKVSAAACLKAANLMDATVGPAIRYSDRILIDARIVNGIWSQPHMNGAKAKMLCLFNRKNKRAEVQEFASQPDQIVAVKDVWWRAEDIGGKGIIDNSEITLMLGSDGKIGGRSGCNGYSASYQITGDDLKVYPPMIGTRMACAPALMNQEQTYLSLIETAHSFRITPEDMLMITSANGETSRFARK